MDSTALATAMPRFFRHARHVPMEAAGPLSFNDLDGPIVTFAGAHGGCGVTTLAGLLAVCCAEASRRPVFACDVSSLSGDLAALFGGGVEASIHEVCEDYVDKKTARDLYGIGVSGVRVADSLKPRRPALANGTDLHRFITHVGTRHGLTICDCGRIGDEAAYGALAAATHAVWVSEATSRGVEKLRSLSLSGALRSGAEHELFAIVATKSSSSRRDIKSLRDIAGDRASAVLLVPRHKDIGDLKSSSPKALDVAEDIARQIKRGVRK